MACVLAGDHVNLSGAVLWLLERDRRDCQSESRPSTAFQVLAPAAALSRFQWLDFRSRKGSGQSFANRHQRPPTSLQRFVTVWSIGEHSVEIALHQQFEKQRLQGVIDQTGDLQELKDLAKQLVDLYFKQKAATAWAVEQATS